MALSLVGVATLVGCRGIWQYTSRYSAFYFANRIKRACPSAGVGPMRGGMMGRGGFAGGFRGGFAGGQRTATCFKCGGPNHYARDCQALAMKCYACGKLVRVLEQRILSPKTDSLRATFHETVRHQMVAPLIPLVRCVIDVGKQVISHATAPQPKPTVKPRLPTPLLKFNLLWLRHLLLNRPSLFHWTVYISTGVLDFSVL